MKIFFALFALLLMSTIFFGQEPKPETQDLTSLKLPTSVKKSFPVPEMSLHAALKFAEEYLKKQGANLSELYLIEAQFTFAGAEKNPPPCWRFRWRKKESESLPGSDDDIYVFMDGTIWDPPVM